MDCDHCHGSGKHDISTLDCSICDGSGELCDECGRPASVGMDLCHDCLIDQEEAEDADEDRDELIG